VSTGSLTVALSRTGWLESACMLVSKRGCPAGASCSSTLVDRSPGGDTVASGSGGSWRWSHRATGATTQLSMGEERR